MNFIFRIKVNLNVLEFQKRYKEIFEEELSLGRVIRYTESYSLPLTRSSLKYFTHQNTATGQLPEMHIRRHDNMVYGRGDGGGGD